MARDAILYSDRLREYDLGHVLTGERYERFMTLYRRRLGDDFDGRQFQGPGPAPGRLVCARIGRTVLSGSPGRLRPGRRMISPLSSSSIRPTPPAGTPGTRAASSAGITTGTAASRRSEEENGHRLLRRR